MAWANPHGCVTDDGFEFQGKTYRSLTKIALHITGAQWSGPRFFGLTKRSATATATLSATDQSFSVSAAAALPAM